MVICEICKNQFKSLSFHVWKHKINITKYQELYPNSAIYSQELREKFSKNIKGDRNPGYNHGGKLSPWSKKGINYNPEAKRKAKENYTKDKRSTNKEYWIKQGFSEQEAIKKVSERQTTFSKEICIQKYGEEKGLEIWNKRQEKWISTLNNKPIEEKTRINKLKGSGFKSSISKESIYFFDDLIDRLKIKNATYKENEFIIYYNNTNNFFRYDFCIEDKNIIIEYNSLAWHPRKEILNEKFESWKNPFDGSISPIDKQAKDLMKLQIARDNGYRILEIWSHEDYENNIKKAMDFINA